MAATAIHSWDGVYTGDHRWYIRILPSLTDLAFLLPAFLILFILPGTKTLLLDGDTGWHIRTGEWILQHRAVPTVDMFSFTKPHETWFAWEWGWDLLFASIHQSFGLGGVALANVVVLCLISALLYRLIRRCCGNDLLALLFTTIALFGSTIHWLARPHLFSWLFILLFSHALLSAGEGDIKALWPLPFFTLLWANIHGAFFVGVLMLGISASSEALRVLTGEHSSWQEGWVRARPYIVCAAGCVAASFINPYTWHLHQHVFGYLRDSRLLDEIQEFQSPNFHHGPNVFFEGMLLLGVVSVAWCFRHGKLNGAMLILVWAHFALLSARNIPIFLFLAAPWTACTVQHTLMPAARSGRLSRFRVVLSEICTELQPMDRIRRWHLISVFAVLFMVCSLAKGDPKFDAGFDAKRFPESAIPVLESTKAKRVFTYDQWGDYLIYRMPRSERVFLDGRSDFYGADFVIACEHVLAARYDWEAELQRFAVDTVVLRPDSPLATVLKSSRKWRVVLDDASVIVFRSDLETKRANALHRQQAEFSSVFANGRKELGASFGLQVDG